MDKFNLRRITLVVLPLFIAGVVLGRESPGFRPDRPGTGR